MEPEDNTIPFHPEGHVSQPSIPEIVQMVHDSYQNIQNCAQLLMNQTPKDQHNNVGMAMSTTQQRLMEGIFWFEQAAALALPQTKPEE